MVYKLILTNLLYYFRSTFIFIRIILHIQLLFSLAILILKNNNYLLINKYNQEDPFTLKSIKTILSVLNE